MNSSASPTVLIVPGLRDEVEAHWQTHLAGRLAKVHVVPPMGRANLDCAARVAAIEHALSLIDGPVVVVAHSGGCVMMAHWAGVTRQAQRVVACLLATPPDFDHPMPVGYPSLDSLRAGGWLPVPRERLPFRSLVAASRNDPLASFERVQDLARDWGSEFEDLGLVGHLNPASGFGPWDRAEVLIQHLSSDDTQTPTLVGDRCEPVCYKNRPVKRDSTGLLGRFNPE